MTIADKAHFLANTLFNLLGTVAADTPPKWGKMNAQQMIEHMGDYVGMAYGKNPQPLMTPAERLPKMQGFLMSEKPFPENTPNALLPDVPPPTRYPSMADAIEVLQAEVKQFFAIYDADANKVTDNPFFGSLNYEQQVQLLHKHTTHHLRQFSISDESMGLK
jgi:hypothetical protein